MTGEMLLSIIIPAYNEEKNLPEMVESLALELKREKIPFELVLVNDNSQDGTGKVIDSLVVKHKQIIKVDRTPPGGYGRAVRSGLEACRGDAIIICMADSSDDPVDVVRYYRKLEEGYDCVFGSRFTSDSVVKNYPFLKLLANRLVNRIIKFMFWCKFNDLTNAFKAYRREVVENCGPYHSCHFNLTLEMSLEALIRKYNIVQIPINWYGRSWGCSNLSLRKMGRRYLEVLIKCYADKLLISDDLEEEKIKTTKHYENELRKLEKRVIKLEKQNKDASRK